MPRSARPSRLHIQLLGPVEIQVDGHSLAVDTRKAIALLAFVAVADRPVSRETLAALLWPDSPDSRARGALRRTLSVLNSALEGAAFSIDRTTVSLDAAAVDLDTDQFRAALATARDHGHPTYQQCQRCRSALQEALALARGPFMEGFALRDSDEFDEWLLAGRESHQRELAGALERLVSEQVAAANWEGAVSAGRRWSSLDPLHEPAHRALMEAYARSGETAAAVRQYRDAAANLERELGVAPLPETTKLNEAIVSGEIGSEQRWSSQRLSTGGESPAGTPTTPPLVGRDDELQTVMGKIDAATPNGRLTAIEGEAGVGKTRLADRVVEIAVANGHPVAAARCYPGEEGITFGPIMALLRARLASDDGASALASLPARSRAALSMLTPEFEVDDETSAAIMGRPGPAARLALLDAIVDGLTSSSAPDVPPRASILRLDDLQWADESTLETLAFMARRLEGRSVMVLVSWRREELDERAAPILAELRSATGTLVRLGRLDADEVRTLIDALVGADQTRISPSQVDELVEEAEGLPLYVVEALASGDRPPGAVPAGMRALLQARLAALSDVASQVVTAAAIIGRSFGIEMVREVSGRSDDETVVALEELLARGIVREAADHHDARYDFAHARLRDVAYEATSIARRRLLHRRAAAAHGALADGSIDQLSRLVHIARHKREAGLTAEAAEAFREAGDLAGRVFANREAVEYLEAALALGHPETGSIHEAIADIRTRIGDYPGAIAAYEMAAAAAPPDRVAEIEHRLGKIHLRRADLVSAEAHLAAALAALDAAGDPSASARSRVLADRAVVAARAGRPEQATILATDARDLAADDVSAEAEADRIIGLLARERGDTATAHTALERSLAAAEELPDPRPSIAALNALSLLAADEGDVQQAIALAETALATAQRTGERHLEAALENNLADALEAAGRREEAMAHLKAAAAGFADIGTATGDLEPGIWMLESW